MDLATVGFSYTAN